MLRRVSQQSLRPCEISSSTISAITGQFTRGISKGWWDIKADAKINRLQGGKCMKQTAEKIQILYCSVFAKLCHEHSRHYLVCLFVSQYISFLFLLLSFHILAFHEHVSSTIAACFWVKLECSNIWLMTYKPCCRLFIKCSLSAEHTDV